jgi:hypothetical protein
LTARIFRSIGICEVIVTMHGYHYISKDLCGAGDGASGFGPERERPYNAPDVGVVDFTLVMHHVDYVVADVPKAVEWAQARGFTSIADAPFTNPLGQQVRYFDPDTTNGVLIHLTKLPARHNTVGVGQGVKADKIIHAGYLVRNAEEAVTWYVDKFDGVHVAGRAYRAPGP